MSLAVADWLVGIFVMPFAVALHITGSWEFGWILCDIWISLDVCLCTASILSLCAISIDRYLAVTQPLTYSRKTRSKKLALYMILCVWLLALVITCPPILGWYDKDRHRDKKCGYNQNRGYVVFSGMGSFFIPLLVVLYVYAKISCVIARRHNNLEALNQQHNLGRHEMIKHTCSHHHHHHHQHKPNHDESDKSEKGSSESEENLKAHNNNNNHHVLERERRKSQASCSLSLQRGLRLADKCTRVSSLKRESKTAQTLSVVVGGFIACWLPFFIVYLANPFLPDGTISPLLSSSLTWLGWLNSAINPFIYAFYSPDFRLAFWRLTIKHCNKSKRSRAQRAHMNMLDSSCRMRKQNHVTYNLRHHS
uniref:Octopamine receptor n=1 Tax=Cacopsylla melanoneura TaxID=428564 RepID=A0A8D8YL49_9HEMI